MNKYFIRDLDKTLFYRYLTNIILTRTCLYKCMLFAPNDHQPISKGDSLFISRANTMARLYYILFLFILISIYCIFISTYIHIATNKLQIIDDHIYENNIA